MTVARKRKAPGSFQVTEQLACLRRAPRQQVEKGWRGDAEELANAKNKETVTMSSVEGQFDDASVEEPCPPLNNGTDETERTPEAPPPDRVGSVNPLLLNEEMNTLNFARAEACTNNPLVLDLVFGKVPNLTTNTFLAPTSVPPLPLCLMSLQEQRRLLSLSPHLQQTVVPPVPTRPPPPVASVVIPPSYTTVPPLHSSHGAVPRQTRACLSETESVPDSTSMVVAGRKTGTARLVSDEERGTGISPAATIARQAPPANQSKVNKTETAGCNASELLQRPRELNNRNDVKRRPQPPIIIPPSPPLPHIHVTHVHEDKEKRFGIGNEQVTVFDVLCGRGGGTNNHMGNVTWRSLVKQYKRDYDLAKRQDKATTSYAIVVAIRKNSGRFLKYDDEKELWFEIGDEKAKEKTSQQLREGNAKNRRQVYESSILKVKEQQEKTKVSLGAAYVATAGA